MSLDYTVARILVQNASFVEDNLERKQFVASLAMSGVLGKPDELRDLLRDFWRDETNRLLSSWPLCDCRCTRDHYRWCKTLSVNVLSDSKFRPSNVPMALLRDVPWLESMDKKMNDIFSYTEIDEDDEACVMDLYARGIDFPDDVIEQVVDVDYEGRGFRCSEKLVLIIMDENNDKVSYTYKMNISDIDSYGNGYDIPLAWFAVTAGYMEVLERVLQGSAQSARADRDLNAYAEWMHQGDLPHAEDFLTTSIVSMHDECTRVKLCTLLMRHGAQPHTVDDDGGYFNGCDSSPFMVAAQLGDMHVCTLFLKSGSDPMATTKFTDDELECRSCRSDHDRFSSDDETHDPDYFEFGQDWRSRGDVPSGSSPYTEAIREGRSNIVDLVDEWCMKRNPGRHIVRRAIARIFSNALHAYEYRYNRPPTRPFKARDDGKSRITGRGLHSY